MNPKIVKALVLWAMLGMAYWFFGNLYEAVVFSPNWVVDSSAQLLRLHQFFIVTSPTLYFVPITQIATVLVWVARYANKHSDAKKPLRLAVIFSIAATLVNIFIVSTTVIKLFTPENFPNKEYMHALAWRWNALNLIRIATVGITVRYLFKAYLALSMPDPEPHNK